MRWCFCQYKGPHKNKIYNILHHIRNYSKDVVTSAGCEIINTKERKNNSFCYNDASTFDSCNQVSYIKKTRDEIIPDHSRDQISSSINRTLGDDANHSKDLADGKMNGDGEHTRELAGDVPVVTKYISLDFDQFNRRRKVALLLGYYGAGYHGMQKSAGVETIELRLMEALAAINAISADLKDEFLVNNNSQFSYNKASRTDKGVSAARQVVSLKLIAKETFLQDVNDNLPKEIQVFGIERVPIRFNAKNRCSGRSYEYLIPTVAFAPSKEIMDSTYKLSDEQLNKVRSILQKYVGRHNFHNYTRGKRFSERSAKRYIAAFKANNPFEYDGQQFISLEVHGQSFMIHQIRKMIGLCIAICRGYCPEDTIEKSWSDGKLDVPKAPGLGLLLNRVNFAQYNKNCSILGTHNPLTFEGSELEVERYKTEYLYPTIIEEEIKNSSIIQWLETLNKLYEEDGI